MLLWIYIDIKNYFHPSTHSGDIEPRYVWIHLIEIPEQFVVLWISMKRYLKFIYHFAVLWKCPAVLDQTQLFLTMSITHIQSGKLLKRTYHHRSTYRYTATHIECAKDAKLICCSTYQISFFLNSLFSWFLFHENHFMSSMNYRA